MNPRKFLEVAKRLLTRSSEEDWRTAAGRTYYAVSLECRDALRVWGFVAPRSESVHTFVRNRFFLTPNNDLIDVGRLLGELADLRVAADYEMNSSPFRTKARTVMATQQADKALSLLDDILNNVAKRTAAIAALHNRWP